MVLLRFSFEYVEERKPGLKNIVSQRGKNTVRETARLRGLELNDAGLEQRALQWDPGIMERSCRTAGQFLDYLCGEPGAFPGRDTQGI